MIWVSLLVQPRAWHPELLSDRSVPFLFTSKRERWLWSWTFVVVVAIYSTLALTPLWADFLRDRELVDALFVAAFFIMAMAILAVGLMTRPGLVEVGIGVGVAAVYLMVLVRMAIPKERTHLFEYSLVGILIFFALEERRANGGHMRFPAAVSVLATTRIGWIDELIQWVLPDRVYDIRDVGFNALAGFLAVSSVVLLRWARQRRRV